MAYLSSEENYSRNQVARAMEPEQFTQVVEAILEGKYSWACVLILRFAGYNPCHYIPRRTYNRLVRENVRGIKREPMKSLDRTHSYPAAQAENSKPQIRDLAYVETLDRQQDRVKGGRFAPVENWLSSWFRR